MAHTFQLASKAVVQQFGGEYQRGPNKSRARAVEKMEVNYYDRTVAPSHQISQQRLNPHIDLDGFAASVFGALGWSPPANAAYRCVTERASTSARVPPYSV